MELKVEWTEIADIKLQRIYKYYQINASESVAEKLVLGIITKSKQLKKWPESGQLENIYNNLFVEFRSLKYKTYKIFYAQKGKVVYVLNVFDMRQNPETIFDEMKQIVIE